MNKEERKELKALNNELKAVIRDVRAMQLTHEIPYQSDRLDEVHKKYEQFITGSGTGKG